MNGGEARTVCFNPNGVMNNAWKNTEATITIVDNTATIQDTSKKEWAEELECPLLDKGLWWSSDMVWTWQAITAPTVKPMSRRATI